MQRVFKHLALLALTTSLLASTTSVLAASIEVTNNNDSGSGSLRSAVKSANNGDIIIANANIGEIILTSGQIDVDQTITIKGDGADYSVISGDKKSRIFASTITNNTLTIENLHLKSGFTSKPANDVEDCFF